MTPLRLKLFVFLGAILLFAQEPLVGKLLLPSSGGSFHVWATCLMFFQGALFLGYLYCHVLAGRLGRWHLLLVAAPLAFLPVGRWLQDVSPDPTNPAGSILLVLALSIGVPFTVLATTGVLAQRWLAESSLPEKDNPYHLFAASNGGSLLALIGYPLLIEPFLGLTAQRWVWSAAYLGYVALAFVVAPRKAAASAPTSEPESEPDPSGTTSAEEPAPTRGDWLMWCLLAAAPSACLMAVTNVIALDLGSAPLVWVVPLSIYLASFILIFGPRSWYPKLVRRFWVEATAVGLLIWFINRGGFGWTEGLVHLGVLFLLCLVGHGELYRSRPAPKHLTGFYLTVALGGWLGGVFVSLVAPHVFSGLAEYPLSAGLLALTLLVYRRKAFTTWFAKEHRLLVAGSVVLLSIVVCKAGWEAFELSRIRMVVTRNVYGIYRVQDVQERGLPVRWLTHGRTVHGKELGLEAGWGKPIGFFHPSSPLGRIVRSRPHPCNAAIVGLGTGALAAHLRAGDSLVYYELDPLVKTLAETHFHYLERTPADVRYEMGDARLNMRNAAPASFDLILVDAFSSDAIPTHLLTREALELYRRKLKPNGLIAFHISNRYYDLRPVLAATSASLDPPLPGGHQLKFTGLATLEDETICYVLSPDPATLEPLWAQGFVPASEGELPKVSPWTDDYANLLAALWAGYELRRKLLSSPR